MLMLALARGGEFRTLPLSGHACTQPATIANFLDVKFHSQAIEDGSVRVSVD